MDPISLQLDTTNLWGWLVRLLSKDPGWLSDKVKFFLPNVDPSSSTEALDPAQRVVLQLKKLHAQGLDTWKEFIHCVCMEQDVPLDLEVWLLSIWGHGDGFPSQLGAGEESHPEPQLHHGLKQPHQSCGSSPPGKQFRKQHLELVWRYLQQLRTSAQQRYGGGLPGPGQSLSFHQAYVPPILQRSRATAPFDTQEEIMTGDTKAEDDTDVSIRDLFNTMAKKGPRVTVLLGKAGMGKSTLAHRLCQKWADGQLDHFQALFLFEFRQLNLLTRALTLPQLLFDLYLNPESGADVVLRYLEENAGRVLLIFDGLDEALHPCSSRDTPGSAFALFSGLCCGTLLPGCWVMVTSRPGKLPACLPTEAATFHMWGFDALRVREYVGRFFRDQPWQEAALAELRADGRLRNLCAVPALCQVACLCLRHLLPGRSPGESAALLPTVTQLYMQMVLALSSHGCLPDTSLLGLGKLALLGLETGKVIFYAEDTSPPVMAFGAAHSLLTSFCVRTGPGYQETGYAFTHLSLQEFFAALMLVASPEVDRDTLVHHVTLHSRWVLRTKAKLSLLDQQSTFLAGLASCACRSFLSRLAQRDEAWVGDRQAAVIQALRKLATPRLTGPKLVELCHCVEETQEPGLAYLAAQSLPYQLSFHNFPLTYTNLAALASILEHRDAPIHLNFEGCPLEPHCPEALVGCGQVENLSFKSRKCGDAFAEALSRSLPTMGSLQKLGLAGSRITSQGIRRLVQALPLCPQLEEISLQNNQLKSQEVLNIVEVLPCLLRLRKLDLSHNNVSVSTLLCLARVAVTCPTVQALQARQAELILLLSPPTETATELGRAPDLQGNATQSEEALTRRLTLRFQKCELQVHDAEVLAALLQEGPHLEEVDLSGNQLEDEGCRLMAEAAAQLHISRKLDLSDNGLTAAGVHCVLSAASLGRSLAELHISLQHKTVVLMFAQEPEQQEETQKRAAFLDSLMSQMPSELPRSSRRIRLTHCGLQAKHLEQLCKALGGSSHLGRLCHLDLSGNALGDQGATLLAQLLPGLGALQSLNLSENGFSLDAVFSLAQSFSALEWLLHLHIRAAENLEGRAPPGPAAQSTQSMPSVLQRNQAILQASLTSQSGLLPCLGSGPLSLLRLLPPSAFSLESQCVLLRGDKRGRDTLTDGSLPEFPAGAQFFGFGQRCIPRSFRLQECQLEPQSLSRLFETLEKCPAPLEVELSCEVLSDQSLETLLRCSSRLPQLSLLQLNHTGLSPRSPFLLADIFSLCPRVQKVELRSLQHVSLHFRSSEEQDGVCCGFMGCSLGQEHMEPLCWLLSKCEDLNQLDLSANQLGDDGLKRLLECLPQLPISGSLVLNHNSISQEGALYLVEVLSSCPCAREALANLGSEQSVRIHFSRQEEAGKTLRLSECIFSPEHVPRLATGLSQALQLTELTLTRCCLGLEQLTDLLSLVRRPAGLLSLRVEEPWVGRIGERALLEVSAQASGTVTQISISKTQEQLCVRLEFPRQEENSEAVALRLTYPSLFVGPLMETCTRLQQLSLSQVNLSDDSSLLLQSLLLSLYELKEFRLTSSCVSTEGLAHLASGLSHCHHLEELDLSNNQFSEEGTRVLMRALEGKCRLKRLHLSLLPLGCSTLATLTRGLSHADLLQSLSLSRNGIGDVGCCHLSEALRSATSLEELDLSHNQIGDTGAQHLAAVLPGLPALQKIDLSWNSIGPVGGMPLVKSLTHCRRLEELMLGWNALGDSTALELAQGLPAHLKVLHLPSNRLGPEGALSLGKALDGCPHLEDVSLAENRLAGEVPLFFKGLPLLRKMDLISCEINNQTAKPLTTSLMLCPALEEILLSWNLLGDEAAAELARILPQMGQLKKVDLEKNQITACGAWLLAEGLAQGPGIQVIRLWNNPIAPSVAQRLQSQDPRLDFAFFEDRPWSPRGTL